MKHDIVRLLSLLMVLSILCVGQLLYARRGRVAAFAVGASAGSSSRDRDRDHDRDQERIKGQEQKIDDLQKQIEELESREKAELEGEE